MSTENFKRRLAEYDAQYGPCEWGQDMSPEEQDAFHENLEQRRAELPERFKNASEAVQDMFLIRAVDCTELENDLRARGILCG